MDGLEELNERGAELLVRLAAGPDGDCRPLFDGLYYPVVFRYLRLNHQTLAARVARYLKVDGVVAPEVLAEEVPLARMRREGRLPLPDDEDTPPGAHHASHHRR